VPVDNLEGFTVGVTYFGDMDDLVNPTVVSPDAGGVYRYGLICLFACAFGILCVFRCLLCSGRARANGSAVALT